MKNNNQGFTLVELAIVLVIVGLLIGGILVAQSMINTTRVQAFTRQIGQYDAALAVFKDRFGGLPGDYSIDGLGGTAGDGDGIIEHNSANRYAGEGDDFWIMLSTAGIKAEGDDIRTYTAGYVLGTSVPRAKIGLKTGVYVAGEAAVDMLDTTINSNVYFIADCSAMFSISLDCSSGINGNDAIAVDKKMDDGAGDTGNIAGTDLASAASWATIADATEVAYTAGTDTGAYALAIRMGSSHGDLY